MNEREKIVNELETKGYKFHHTSLCRGYQSVKGVTVEKYRGRFGEGYIMYEHNPNSTYYKYISYFTK